MSKNYQKKSATAKRAEEVPVPPSVTIAVDELAGQLREGLLAMAVGAGLQVAQLLMAESVTALCGPRGSTTRSGPRCGTAASAGR